MTNRTCKVFFRATPEEMEKVYSKMESVGIKNLSAYLRKIVLRGFVIEIDMSDFKDIRRLLSIESNNLNQYARRANETGSIHKADIESLQKSHKELIGLMGNILDKFNDMY
ncbi:plasmid mobilization protein [Butyrivibrio sp. M55]|uniref:plasmid mobilization protein n=1 Tax=Butyrivibrio sp. M55 TaxID=1855323 RepID=UPI001587A2A9|nr:plasmid mobilization relaxosome protein MobC [Butyrivibrio sp. M55]